LHFSCSYGEIDQDTLSKDGTRKFLLRLPSYQIDGAMVEAVFIPFEGKGNNNSRPRGTLCISSQVGCSLSCTFCHTGTQALKRNLTAGEIVGQVMLARKTLGDLPSPEAKSKKSKQKNHTTNNVQRRAVSNIVLMGEGEPLYNYR
jgi:23S rRNA (adenine2503-C2)-methyltransferase